MNSWQDRMRKSGHTGWSSEVIYAYDQLERLALLRSYLSRTMDSKIAALDFGCGTGDFSALLLQMGYRRVCGYDPYVSPTICDYRFTYTDRLSTFVEHGEEFSLVLSVAALDHIVEEAELVATLKRLRKLMAERGQLVLLEYALNDDHMRGSLLNNYQSFRTVAGWTTLGRVSGFRLAEIRAGFHPTASPSRGYRAYRMDLRTRFAARLCKPGFRTKILRPLLRALAHGYLHRYPVSGFNLDENSPFKLMRFES